MIDTETEAMLRTWIPRAVAGEPHAVGVVVRAVHPHVTRFCDARMDTHTRTHTPVEDLVQEVCLALTRALPSYRDHGLPLSRYVFGIATRKIADARSSAARRAPAVHDPDVPGPEEALIDADLITSARQLMDELPEQQLLVLKLRVMQGYSTERTAQMLGTTPGAIRIAQHRALTRIREQLSRIERADTVRSAAR